MRVVFAGTPDVAVPALHAVRVEHEVLAVVTRPDAPQGRKRVLTPSPVAAAASELGIPIIRAARLDAAATEAITALEPDLGVIVAYGGLVREPLLSAPRHGWINLHFSLLPLWRGAAPVQHALIAGDAELGVSIFQLVAGLDAGDIFARQSVTTSSDATADEVLAVLAEAGAGLTAEVVNAIAAGTAVAVPQRGEVTLAPKLTLDDGRLDFSQTGETIYARFRGVTPEPGAFTTIEGTALKILDARLGDAEARLHPGEIRAGKRDILIGTASAPLHVSRVQPAGRAAMSAADWLRGQRETPRAGT